MVWTALAAGIALALLALAARIQARREAAPPLPEALTPVPPTLAVLPVRDEEANVVPCLESLLAQTARPAIRVVDDGSRDRTAELAKAVASRTDRIEVLAAGPLPEGWRGKLHALAVGMAGRAEPWLLFTDADTRHAPPLLARAHAAAADHDLDLVSVAGRQETRGLGEALVTPTVFAVLDALLGDWAEAARGAGPAVANGQFMLIRRRALEESRGLEAVRGAILDDIALAAHLRRHGARTGFWRAGDLLRVRMYEGLAATWRGWRRNLAGIFAGRGAAAAGSSGGARRPRRRAGRRRRGARAGRKPSSSGPEAPPPRRCCAPGAVTRPGRRSSTRSTPSPPPASWPPRSSTCAAAAWRRGRGARSGLGVELGGVAAALAVGLRDLDRELLDGAPGERRGDLLPEEPRQQLDRAVGERQDHDVALGQEVARRVALHFQAARVAAQAQPRRAARHQGLAVQPRAGGAHRALRVARNRPAGPPPPGARR